MTEIKRITCLALSRRKKIAYAVFRKTKRNICIFSAVDSNPPSTINAAEGIIKAIVEEEKEPIDNFSFYDLQTHRGYPHSKKPGVFELDWLSFELKDGKITNLRWYPQYCPKETEQFFKEYIN